MIAEQMLHKLKDPSQKQLLFHEFCKTGIVKFDLSNPEHAALFDRTGKMMREFMLKFFTYLGLAPALCLLQ